MTSFKNALFSFSKKHERFFDCLIAFLLGSYILFLPYENVFYFNGFTILKLLAVILCPLLVFCAITQNRWVFDFKLFAPLAVFYIVGLVSFFYADSKEWWLNEMGTYLANFIMLVCVACYTFSKFQIVYSLVSSVAMGILCSFVLVFQTDRSLETRLTLELFGSYYDPNFLSALLLLSVVCGLYLIVFYAKKMFSRVTIGLFLSFVFVCSLLTGSRTLILTLFCLFVVLVVFLLIRKKTRTYGIVAIFLACVAVLSFYLLAPDSLVQRYSLSSLFDSTEEGGRGPIWKYAFSLFLKSPIYGYGAGSMNVLLFPVYEKRVVCHNLFLGTALELGVLGLLPLLCFFAFLLVKIIRKKDLFAMSLLLEVLMYSFFLDSMYDKFFWSCLLFLLIFLLDSKSASIQSLTVDIRPKRYEISI